MSTVQLLREMSVVHRTTKDGTPVPLEDQLPCLALEGARIEFNDEDHSVESIHIGAYSVVYDGAYWFAHKDGETIERIEPEYHLDTVLTALLKEIQRTHVAQETA